MNQEAIEGLLQFTKLAAACRDGERLWVNDREEVPYALIEPSMYGDERVFIFSQCGDPYGTHACGTLEEAVEHFARVFGPKEENGDA
jgi:hypothetical protein